MKKTLFAIIVLSVFSCGEIKEKKSSPKPKEEVDLINLKNEKQKEIDSLKNLVRQLQQKKDSLKKIIPN